MGRNVDAQGRRRHYIMIDPALWEWVQQEAYDRTGSRDYPTSWSPSDVVTEAVREKMEREG